MVGRGMPWDVGPVDHHRVYPRHQERQEHPCDEADGDRPVDQGLDLLALMKQEDSGHCDGDAQRQRSHEGGIPCERLSRHIGESMQEIRQDQFN